MKSKPRLRDESHAVQGFSRWAQHDGYQTGEIITKNGIVTVYKENSPHLKFTRLDIVWKGRLYMRNIYRWYSDRYASTLANRFADDVINRRIK